MGTQNVDGALAGLKVLDLTRVLAGPLSGMMLGDMGADVIKVEPPSGDDTRKWGPPFIQGESAYFLGCNRNKRSVVLDLKSPEGLEDLKRLIAWADVLLENYKVGTLESWGLTTEWFETHAPQLVHCSITGYGATGPKAKTPGYDFILQAETGLMSICGDPDGEPMKYGVAIVDISTGLLALNAVLAALYSRTATGKGQKVNVSLYETGVFLLANVASNYLATGRPPGRYGNGHPNIVPYTAYSTQNGKIAVSIGNDGQFKKFCHAVDRVDWLDNPAFASNADRVHNREQVDAMINTALTSNTSEHWLQALAQAGIPCGPINSVDQVLNDPQTLAREMVLSVDMPNGETLKTLGFPIKFSDTPSSIRQLPPECGQHTDEILTEIRQSGR